jgi:spore coat protein A, manganese oxidase
LPVDPTLHWANPPGGTDGRDIAPGIRQPRPYTGPVPIVTHVHGAVGVGDESDGYAEAWYLPAAGDIPADYATEGTWYEFFAGKAAAKFGRGWGPGFATFQYPNDRPGLDQLVPRPHAGHDPAQRVRGTGGLLHHPRRAGRRRARLPYGAAAASLPGPAPRANDPFPPNKPYREIPIAIQDRSFNTDGSLFYPDTREFFDEIVGAYIPDGEFSPIWNPEFFGNMIMVNGNTWPFLTVEKRRYRFRFLNGCHSASSSWTSPPSPASKVWQIGNEGGFLGGPGQCDSRNNNHLLMGLAERADVIVDFTNVPLGSYVLGNVGPDEPFGGGVRESGLRSGRPQSTGQVMQFRVVPAVPTSTTPPRRSS